MKLVVVDHSQLSKLIGKHVRLTDTNLYPCGQPRTSAPCQQSCCDITSTYGGEGIVYAVKSGLFMYRHPQFSIEIPASIDRAIVFDWGWGMAITPTTIVEEIVLDPEEELPPQ